MSRNRWVNEILNLIFFVNISLTTKEALTSEEKKCYMEMFYGENSGIWKYINA